MHKIQTEKSMLFIHASRFFKEENKIAETKVFLLISYSWSTLDRNDGNRYYYYSTASTCVAYRFSTCVAVLPTTCLPILNLNLCCLQTVSLCCTDSQSPLASTCVAYRFSTCVCVASTCVAYRFSTCVASTCVTVSPTDSQPRVASISTCVASTYRLSTYATMSKHIVTEW